MLPFSSTLVAIFKTQLRSPLFATGCNAVKMCPSRYYFVCSCDYLVLSRRHVIVLLTLQITKSDINLLKPIGYVMHQQFTIQQLYVLTTLYLCVLHLSENKQRLVPLTP